MDIKALLQSYYDSLDTKNTNWQELWADDAVFADASLTLQAQGKPAVIQSFTPFSKTVARVKIKQLIIEGNAACAIVAYDYVNPKGEKMHQDVAEIWEVKEGKLSKLTIYFDLTAYRQFMRG